MTRLCALCNSPLRADAAPNALYCTLKCAQKATKQRRKLRDEAARTALTELTTLADASTLAEADLALKEALADFLDSKGEEGEEHT